MRAARPNPDAQATPIDNASPTNRLSSTCCPLIPDVMQRHHYLHGDL
ncbi:hypothetical protein ACNKHK_06245 [Shigella flexneri]